MKLNEENKYYASNVAVDSLLQDSEFISLLEAKVSIMDGFIVVQRHGDDVSYSG